MPAPSLTTKKSLCVPDVITVLLDQNVPQVVAPWLSALRPQWVVRQVSDVGLRGAEDRTIFDWTIANRAMIITFDDDFADQRSFPVGTH